jgi:hypothetical protein
MAGKYDMHFRDRADATDPNLFAVEREVDFWRVKPM